MTEQIIMVEKTKKYQTNAERQKAYRTRKAQTNNNITATTRGRPKKYATAAERQAAYRARLKERGLRIVSNVVRDVRNKEKPLHSDVIDLSEVRQKYKM